MGKIYNYLISMLRRHAIKRKQRDRGSRLLADHIAVTTGLRDKPVTEQELEGIKSHERMHRLVFGTRRGI